MIELEQYFAAILDGKIIAGNKMKQAAEMILEQYANPNEYHFDIDIANRHIEFIERFCKQPSGKLGVPLKLELFQKARFQAIFGFVDDNDLRQYNEVLIIEGRKNGKTTETSAVEIDMLINDGEGSPQIYNVATMLEQAKLGFNSAHKMVKQSKLLAKHVKKRASDLYYSGNFGYIKALASNTNSLDGLDVHCAVIDELAAIKNRDLYDLIKQGMGARSQPLLFTITTNGFIRNGIFDAQYDYATKILNGQEENKRFLPLIYELDSPDEWDKEDCWIKANPGLGTIKSYDYLRQMVAKAKADEAFKPTVLVKDFNLKQTAAARWLRYEEAVNDESMPNYNFKYGIGGFDAADSVDLNAATALCMRYGDNKIYRKSMYWIPRGKIELAENQGKRQGVDCAPYDLWEQQGYLRIVEGNKVNKRVILDWFIELRDSEDIYMLYIGYDPWRIDDSLLLQFEMEFGKNALIPVRQGVYSLSQPMKDLKADLSEHRVVNGGNPIDEWCFMNMEIKTDINNNIQPIKSEDQTQRIDGGVACIIAYKILCDKMEEYLTLV